MFRCEDRLVPTCIALKSSVKRARVSSDTDLCVVSLSIESEEAERAAADSESADGGMRVER